MRLLRPIGAALLFAALAAGVTYAAIDDQARPPIPVQHGDPGDPSAYPQPATS